MNPASSNPLLIQDVIGKRSLAFLIDAGIILALWLFLWVFVLVFGALTLGLGWHLYWLMPLVPFLYHFVTLARFGATPGQRLCGLAVRRIADLGPPSVAQALISTLGFYFTTAISGGLLLLAALITENNRTLHDIAAGLIVVRAEALTRASFGFHT